MEILNNLWVHANVVDGVGCATYWLASHGDVVVHALKCLTFEQDELARHGGMFVFCKRLEHLKIYGIEGFYVTFF